MCACLFEYEYRFRLLRWGLGLLVAWLCLKLNGTHLQQWQYWFYIPACTTVKFFCFWAAASWRLTTNPNTVCMKGDSPQHLPMQCSHSQSKTPSIVPLLTILVNACIVWASSVDQLIVFYRNSWLIMRWFFMASHYSLPSNTTAIGGSYRMWPPAVNSAVAMPGTHSFS